MNENKDNDDLICDISILQQSILDILEGFELIKGTEEYDEEFKIQLKMQIVQIKECYLNMKGENNSNENEKDIYLEKLEKIENELF